MEEYFARIPFGHEQRLNLGFGNTCPVCEVQRGQGHEFGCLAEECPKCHTPVVNCYCECLEKWEEIAISLAIAATFTSMDDAKKAGVGLFNWNPYKMSLTEKAAVMYFVQNAPPEILEDLYNDLLSPDLKPCGINEKGEKMFSSIDIADALGVDRDEINETIRNLVDVGEIQQPISSERNN